MASEIAETDFLRHVNQHGPHLTWFLGAGASRSSGLPTATDIIWDLKRRIYCAQQNQDIQAHDISNKAVQARIQGYMESMGFPLLWDASEYSFYFEQYFGGDYASQQAYLREVLSTEKIASTVGHRVLAALLHMGRAQTVFTTNFDEVVETAYSAITGRNLPTFHLEGSYAAIDALNADLFPLYVKLHGDFRYQSVKNLSSDLLHNDQQLQKCFVAAASRFGLIVAGYSGRDENVMTMLRQAIEQNNAFPHGLFWTAPRLSGIASNVHELLEYAHAKGIRSGVVQTGTFDEMLSKIWRHTPDKPAELDGKVRCAGIKSVSIPLPSPGGHYPLLRTNALRITQIPNVCGSLNFAGNIDIGDIRAKLFEVQPDCTLAYTDRILFWGDRAQVETVVDRDRMNPTEVFTLDDLAKQVDESGIVKAFLEEALTKALIANKPLVLRRSNRTWYAVAQHAQGTHDTFLPLRMALGFNGTLGRTHGSVPGLQEVYWAEAVSLRIEERNGELWLLLRPDIWISPLREREKATDFLRQRKLKRWNSQSYEILSAWIGILLGAVGGTRVAEVIAHAGSEYVAKFEISTRTAYSRRSPANGQ